MKEVPAHETLDKLFQTIVKEAETNTKFAEEMLVILKQSLLETIESANTPQKEQEPKSRSEKPAPSKKSKDSFPVKAYNPIIMYRQSGEDLMRVKLNKVTVTNLKKIAKHYQLKLGTISKTKSPTKTDLITAILTWAKNYDAQRKGAAG